MSNEFESDLHPGRPKILFIGFPESSHTHSWIELLNGSTFNVRLFSLPSAEPPVAWPVKTYLTLTGAPRVNTPSRQTVFPPPRSQILRLAIRAQNAVNRGQLDSVVRLKSVIEFATGIAKRFYSRDPFSLEESLAHVIRQWKPDIIHTLGFDFASYFYLRTRKQFNLAGMGWRWIAQARGGPDIALQRYSPEFAPLIREVFETCDHFIADNQINYDYALDVGLAKEKVLNPGMGVVSGAGGMDTVGLRAMWQLYPSRRERVIVWPKAYEMYTSKALPVFEAIIKAWDRIQPCRIEMIWMVQSDVKIWYEKMFPEHIKACCQIFGRLSREETLIRISNARVMIAPSLSDGIPNTMMEAMALGAVPLVSPLDTIVPVVKNEENVIFARNLYPDEIAEALVRLMSDDVLVDRMATNNLVRVGEIADRRQVRARAFAYYESVAELARH
ncbi:MAG: glycosyltransferase [Glaciimonas sp.]|nr:glycosyltransferase [Glaciimonas sp.]